MGRPWPQPGEPLFLDEDIDEILDYLAYEETLCSGGGQPTDESFAVGADDAYSVVALRCHACAAKDRAAKDFADNPGGLRLIVRRDDAR